MKKEQGEKQNEITSALFIDGDYFAKFVFTKNPFDIDLNIKEIHKICLELKKEYNITVVFKGLLRNHADIINYKNKLINHYEKNVRKADPKMLHSQSSYMLSFELQQLKIQVLFTDELNVHETIYQYALNSNFKENSILTSYEHYRISICNDKSKQIKFYDNLVLDKSDSKNIKLSLLKSLDKDSFGKYFIKSTDGKKIKNVDDETVNNFNKVVVKRNLPKTFDNYRQVIIENLSSKLTYTLGNTQFYIKEMSNPHVILSNLRQAVYYKLKIPFVIEEILMFKNDKYYFIPNLVEVDTNNIENYEKMLEKSAIQTFKLLFDNTEKIKTMLFSEYNNHICSIYSEICFLLSIANNENFNKYFKHDATTSTNDSNKKDADKKVKHKLAPEDKVVLKNNCLTCNEKFEKKESELEIYVVRDLKYPVTCQKCIDLRAKEKRDLEEYTKKMKEVNSKEAIEQRQKELDEKREEEEKEKEKKRIEEEKIKKLKLEKELQEEKERERLQKEKDEKERKEKLQKLENERIEAEKKLKEQKEKDDKERIDKLKLEEANKTNNNNNTSNTNTSSQPQTGRWKKK